MSTASDIDTAGYFKRRSKSTESESLYEFIFECVVSNGHSTLTEVAVSGAACFDSVKLRRSVR